MAKHCQVQSYPDYSPEGFLENLNTTLDESATEWEAADALILSKSEARAKARAFLKTMAEFIVIVNKHNLL